MIKKINILITFLFILISLINFFIIINNNKNIFLQKINLLGYEKKYYQSQYLIPNSTKPISDAELYTYVGYKYIIGTNPLYLNAEHLTLGKYLIGLSILVTKNPHYSTLLFVLLTIFFYIKLILKITNSKLAASIGFFLISTDPFIKDAIINGPLLDIYQLFF